MLSGNLRDLPFSSLLQALHGKTGVLELWHLEGETHCTIYIKRGEIRCLEQGGRILESEEAKRLLKSLFSTEQGAFEFAPKAHYRTPCKPSFRWPVERVVRSLSLKLTREKLRQTLEGQG